MRSGHGDQWHEIFGHPYFIARFNLSSYFKSCVREHNGHSILDVGCGSMPYKRYFQGSLAYEGLEIDQERNRLNPNVSYFYDGIMFPLPDTSFDAVLCSQVLEHSFAPSTLLSEINRVLRVGGLLYLAVPFMWPEHEQPYDSQRYTSFGLIHLLEENGFKICTCKKSTVGLSALLQLFIEWVECSIRSLKLDNRLFLIWRMITFIPYSLFNVLAIFSRLFLRLLPVTASKADPTFFLDLVLVAKKKA